MALAAEAEEESTAHVAWGHAAVCPRPWPPMSTRSPSCSINLCMPAQASTCAHFIEERLCCRFHSHMQCFATGRMPHASGSMPGGVEAPGGSCRQLSACWRRQLLKSSSHDGVVHLQQSMQLCRASEPSTRCAGQGTPCSSAWVAAEPGYTVKAGMCIWPLSFMSQTDL